MDLERDQDWTRQRRALVGRFQSIDLDQVNPSEHVHRPVVVEEGLVTQAWHRLCILGAVEERRCS